MNETLDAQEATRVLEDYETSTRMNENFSSDSVYRHKIRKVQLVLIEIIGWFNHINRFKQITLSPITRCHRYYVEIAKTIQVIDVHCNYLLIVRGIETIRPRYKANRY